MYWNIRNVKTEDLPFIISSWFQSYRSNAKIDYQVYNEYQHKLIHKILTHCEISVAVDKNDDNIIYGYIVFELRHPQIVHYIYTKSSYLGLGVATSLLKKNIIGDFYYTAQTKKIIKNGLYNPYLMYLELR